jgi:ATP-binding cassette, subfamily C, bacterial LapB
LVFLAKFHGKPRSADAMMTGLPANESRLSPTLFVRAAQRAGLNARIVKRRLSAIPKHVLPCVIALKDDRACIVQDYPNKKTARIILPETGFSEETVKIKELAKDFEGFAILVKPQYRLDPEAEKELRPKPTFWFWSSILSNWWTYSQVGLAAIFINLFALVSPLFIMTVYDRVIPNNAQETLWVLATGVVSVIIFDTILKTLRAYFIDAAGKKTDVTVATRIFDQVLDMQMKARPASAGAFANTLREFETLRDFFTSATLATLIDLPFSLLFIFILWLLSGSVALVLAVAVPVILFYSLLIQIPLSSVIKKNFKESELKHGVLVETINGLETIKSIGAEARMRGLWEGVVGLTARSSQKARALSVSAVNFAGMVQQLTSVAVVIYGVELISEGEITVGALIACVMLGGRALAPLGQVAQLLTRLNQSLSSLNALNQIMQAPVERPTEKQFLHRPQIKGEVVFDQVKFSYPGRDEPALQGVSFSIKAGERVGIIGRVGSGKSTIAKLLLGLFETDEGTVRVDGTDIRQIDPADLRRNIGYVAQEPFLFRGSIKDNITASAPHTEDQDVLTAAKVAGMEEFIQKLPVGFDLAVGERGEGLSGGQRQGITIARALLGKPNLLILDEPTSSMDPTSEAFLNKNIKEYLPGRTVILATHRMSMLAAVDRVILMDQGKVLADGPKVEVLQQLKTGKFRE